MNRQWMIAGATFALVGAAGCADNQTLATHDACAPGTATEVPAYNWQNGHLVREGWKCRSIYSDG